MARAAAAAHVAAPARTAPVRRPTPARRPAPARRRPAHKTATHKTREFARVGSARALDALLHGPALIGLVFVLLVGVVFSNVALLQKNRAIAKDAERASVLKRENAGLRRDVAELGSSERIQTVAAERGLVLPAPGEVRYLRANPQVDARNAANNLDDPTAIAGTPDAVTGTTVGIP